MQNSSQNEGVVMTQEDARQRFIEGAILVITGLPTGTEFGMDLTINKVDEMFRGMKMIPPGPHFVYTAAEDSVTRAGFIHYFKKQEIVILIWDEQIEELKRQNEIISEIEKVKIRNSLPALDKVLAPYDFDQLERWQTFTKHISEDVILRITPECGIIRSSVEFQSCPDSERPKNQLILARSAVFRSNQTEDDLLPNLSVLPGTLPRFTRIPPLYSKDASPAEITQSHLDSKQAIQNYFDNFTEPIEAIRELQTSFVLFLCGWSVDALAHWRKLLGLFSKSESSVDRFRSFYVKYLEILRAQLPELPIELMTPSANNTVFKDVKQLISNCILNDLKDEAEILIASLNKDLSWYFDDLFDENPDDLPVVVEIQ